MVSFFRFRDGNFYSIFLKFHNYLNKFRLELTNKRQRQKKNNNNINHDFIQTQIRTWISFVCLILFIVLHNLTGVNELITVI